VIGFPWHWESPLGSLCVVPHICVGFPPRDALLDSLFGEGRAKEAAFKRYFTPLTVLIVASVYLLAVAIPSIWEVIGFVGSVATTGQCRRYLSDPCSIHQPNQYIHLLSAKPNEHGSVLQTVEHTSTYSHDCVCRCMLHLSCFDHATLRQTLP